MKSVAPQEVFDYLAANRHEMITFLRQLVLAESPSSVPDSQAMVMTFLYESLQGLGFNVRIIPGRRTGGYILAYSKNTARNIRYPIAFRSLRYGMANRHPERYAILYRGQYCQWARCLRYERWLDSNDLRPEGCC